VDGEGNVLGAHRGIGHYTVGQRKGLGLSLGKPVFVTSIDPSSNSVTVGGRDDLAVGGLVADEASFVDGPPPEGARVEVQHRAHGEVHGGTLVSSTNKSFEVVYDAPVTAVAPGQSAVLYSADDPDAVMGGGIISATVPAPVPA
jgi:tRNA-uridine 2-sulfurtransferase